MLDPLFARYELQGLQPDWDETVLLGYRKTGEPRLAVPVGIDADDLTSQYKPADGRTLFREMLIDEVLLGEFAQPQASSVGTAITASAAAAARRWRSTSAATSASAPPANT